jgi:hypothetical protein
MKLHAIKIPVLIVVGFDVSAILLFGRH